MLSPCPSSVWMLAGLLLAQPAVQSPPPPRSSSPSSASATSPASAASAASAAPSQPVPSAAPAAADAPEIDRLLADSAKAYWANDNPRGRALAEAALAQAVERGLAAYEAEALLRLGRDAVYFRRYPEARERLERSRMLFQEAGNRARGARVAIQLAIALDGLNETARGVELLLDAWHTLREIGGDDEGLAMAGERLMFDMPGSEAKSRLRTEVLAVLEGAKHRATVCNVHQEWGDELFGEGRYAEAHARLTVALRCFEQTTDRGRTGRTLVSLGRIERAHGQLEQALDYYTRALALQDQVKDVPALVQSLNAMAVTLNMLGRREEALACIQDAVARARGLQNPSILNALLGTLGGLLVDDGRYAEAIPILEESRAREQGDFLRTHRLISLALAHHGLGKLADAYALANEAVVLSTTGDGGGPELRLRALGVRIDAAASLGELDAATRDLSEALRIIEDLRAHSLSADAMRRGFGDWHQGYFSRSIDILIARKDGRAALEVSEQARSRAFLDRLADRRAGAADAPTASAGPAPPTTSAARGVVSTTMREGRTAVASEMTGRAVDMVTPARAAQEPGAGAAPIASAPASPIARPTSTAAAVMPAVLTPPAMTAAIASSARTAARNGSAVAATATPASLADIRALAARLRSTWLMFWVGDTATIVWVVRPDGDVRWARVPIRATQLEALVAKSVPRSTGLDALASVALGSRAHLRPWRELYRLLIRPIAAHLPAAPGSRLTIVPHGPLFRVSFAGLQDERGRYLLERYDLHYVPAAGVLQFTSMMAARQGHDTSSSAAASMSRALLVGDPGASTVRVDLESAPSGGNTRESTSNGRPGSAAPTVESTPASVSGPTPTPTPTSTSTSGSPWSSDSSVPGPMPTSASAPAALPPLDWARREVFALARLLPGPNETLVGPDATETAVRARLPGRRVIHFATHGVVHNGTTVPSYLAVRREEDSRDPHADGRLTADEIDDLSLDADLVVLSACGTALGPISGDGVQGFTRAFLAAGAGTVVATTWSVADRTSYQVMDGFYRAWQGGRSKSRALREAQLAMLRRLRAGRLTLEGVVLPESPWLWAGFVLVGNP